MIALPDEPRWVEAHGIAGDPRGWTRQLGGGGGGGLALGHDTAKLIVIANVTPAAVTALAREHPHHTMLVVAEPLVQALHEAGRSPVRALIHTLPDPLVVPELEGAVALPDTATLDHIPAALAEELDDVRATSRGPIWTCFVDGDPVAFAYAPWRSAKWFDVSVDTLPAARQLGLGTIVAAAMIQHECAGRERMPVWGADEDNAASLRLAKRLGFVEIDHLWVAPP